MADVKVSLVPGNTARRDQYGWAEKSALIAVDGLTRTLSHDDLVASSWTAAVADGFTYGSQHPQIAGLYLLGDLTFNVVASRRVEIACTYKRPAPAEDPTYVGIRGDIVLVQEKTNKDKDGADITVSWKPDATRAAKTQTGMVDVWRPCRTLEFTKTLSTNPVPVAGDLVGYTNSATFQGKAAGYWLCMGFNFNSPDGGTSWETSVKFAGNANLWKQTVYYLLEGGGIPENYDAAYQSGNCVKTVEVYGRADMSVLGLPDASGA